MNNEKKTLITAQLPFNLWLLLATIKNKLWVLQDCNKFFIPQLIDLVSTNFQSVVQNLKADSTSSIYLKAKKGVFLMLWFKKPLVVQNLSQAVFAFTLGIVPFVLSRLTASLRCFGRSGPVSSRLSITSRAKISKTLITLSVVIFFFDIII